jgi:hypothetical protein
MAAIITRADLGLQGAESVSTNKFLGATSCASSGCHGGGGENQNQFLVWSLRDFHSQRPVATLTTARSRQIATALQIQAPTTDERCTACHAPLIAVPAAWRGEAFKASEGISCESCHGPAEGWLRAHTRPDYSHADRVFTGMRDLKNLYGRANSCVPCHQAVATTLLEAGHPELIFELDGQSVSQPKHWRERADWSGAQAWFVGQAVALRELSWQLAREPAPNDKLVARWSALLWVLQKLDGLDREFPTLGKLTSEPNSQNLLATLNASDELAKRAAGSPWTDDMSRRALATLVATGDDFRQSRLADHFQARRAERLVLALDRLLATRKGSQPNNAADANLNRLFLLAQSLPDFDSSEFATALNQFAKSLSP